MKILLVYPGPDKVKKARFGFSYELLIIATILKKYHTIRIHDFSCESFIKESFTIELLNEKYDLIMVECDSFALKRSQNIKNASQILSLCKGITPTLAFGNYCYIQNKDFELADYTVKKNDINLILEFINEIDFKNVIPLVYEYDDLPYIDRNLLNIIHYYKLHQTNTLLQTSKGCQNTCIFCQRKGWQNVFVTHSDNYVINELKYLIKNNYHNIWIIDENFTFDLARAKRLLKSYLTLDLGYKPNLFISSWANIDYEFIDLAALCNIRIISFGIETGNTAILQFYRKNINLETIPNLISYANRKGIFTVGNFILGAPMETEDTIKETFDLIRRCEFDQINFKTLDYMIGSELHERLPKELKKLDHVFSCSENGLCNFSLNTLIKKKTEFLKVYYAEHKLKIRDKIIKYGMPYRIH